MDEHEIGTRRVTYQESAERICQIYNFDADLDAETPGRIVLHVNLWAYKLHTVRFSITLRTRSGDEYVDVLRIDTAHGTVHRHRFDRAGTETDRKQYVVIPDRGVSVVEEWFERSYNLVVDSADGELERWSRSG